MLAATTLGFLGWWRSNRLAEDHAARARWALDEMGTHYNNMQLCTGSLKTARRPSEKPGIMAIMKTFEAHGIQA